MTDLSDFLKCKKVRCIEGNYSHGLIRGKVYDVISTEYNEFFGKLFIKIDKNGIGTSYLSDFFEPVLDSAENPLENMKKLTPKFEAVEPTFKVGDKVYRGLKGEIRTVERVEIKSLHFAEGGCDFIKHCCHATTENYKRLQAAFPDIEFEQPPKELAGSDLCRAIKAKGKKFIICAVSDISEEDAINNYLNGDKEMDVIFEIDDELDHPFVAVWGNLYKFAVPLSEETGEPLTESVLND